MVNQLCHVAVTRLSPASFRMVKSNAIVWKLTFSKLTRLSPASFRMVKSNAIVWKLIFSKLCKYLFVFKLYLFGLLIWTLWQLSLNK